MSTTRYYYHRIKANSSEKYRDVQPLDFQADIVDKVEQIQSLFTHRTPASTGIWSRGDENITISNEQYTMFCIDGQPRVFTTWFEEEAQSKLHIPNHRANAMFDMGRFTSKECIKFSNNRNQSLKEQHGCNFVYGDVVCEVPIGTPGPDHSIYNNNPLLHFMKKKEPSSDMVSHYGQVLAANKLSPTRKYNTVDLVWEDTSYFLAPKKCNNVEFKYLLQSWGVTAIDLTRLFENLENPQEYGTVLQYSIEWSELDQSDKDSIWRLEHKARTSSSACFNQLGVEIPTENTYEMVFSNKPRTAQRQRFIKAMKEYEDRNPVIFSLADIERQLSSCLRENAALIYWNHSLSQKGFNFMLPSDKSMWKKEMLLVRDCYRDGRVTSISAGEPLHINGTALYPIEVMYRQPRECVAYYLVRRRGISNDRGKTPYFFVSESNRDNVLGFLTRDRNI